MYKRIIDIYFYINFTIIHYNDFSLCYLSQLFPYHYLAERRLYSYFEGNIPNMGLKNSVSDHNRGSVWGIMISE